MSAPPVVTHCAPPYFCYFVLRNDTTYTRAEMLKVLLVQQLRYVGKTTVPPA